MRIQDQMRMASVKRWHIIDTTKVQTVAEHTFNVMLIYREFCNLSSSYTMTKEALLSIMNHDMDEVVEGDIPSPAKPKRDWGSYTKFQLVLKACDILESLVFIRQFGTGRTGTHAANYMESQWIEVVGALEQEDRSAMLIIEERLMCEPLSS